MRKFFTPADAPYWLEQVLSSIRQALSDVWPTPLSLVPYTVAKLPVAADWAGGVVYVPDETGGAVIAFSDGTNWRRVTDRAIVS